MESHTVLAGPNLEIHINLRILRLPRENYNLTQGGFLIRYISMATTQRL